jgi:glycosyltransferase involved in cell wall biosynthesis
MVGGLESMYALSVITICKNNEATMEATLNSVISQKTEAIEYIVVDGASTDRTKEIIEENKDKIDLFISEPDTGIYNAINKGITAARGRYICLIHAGDQLAPDVAPRLLQEIAKADNEILYGCLKTFKNGKFDAVWGWNIDYLPQKMVPHSAALVPKEVYAHHGFYDETMKIAADYELFSKFYVEQVPFKFIDVIVAYFNREGISSHAELVKDEDTYVKMKYGFPYTQKKPMSLLRIMKRHVKRVLHEI